MTAERDAFQWAVDIGAVVSGVASVVALFVAAKALRDTRDTAEHLAESRRLASEAQLRADREQAARVLSIAEELGQQMFNLWQQILVGQEEPPGPGQANRLQRLHLEDSARAQELYARASSVDLTAVQYADAVRALLGIIGIKLEAVRRLADAASPAGGATLEAVMHQKRWWTDDRPTLIHITVQIQDVLGRLEAHFPLNARLLRDTDSEGFQKDLFAQLGRDKEARVRAVIRRVRGMGE